MSEIDEEQREAMRESLARVLGDSCSESDVRRVIESPDAHDPALWRTLADLGLLATLMPARYGGLGGGAREIELLMEEAGKALLPGAFLSSAVLAPAVLLQSTDEDIKARLLPAVAEGRSIATVALTGSAGRWDDEDVDVTAQPSGDAALLSGVADFVSDGALADVLLVVGGRGTTRMLYEVTDRTGLSITRQKTFDPTQRLARIAFKDVAARPVSGVDGPAIDRALDLVRVALVGRQAGAAQRNFEFTVEYLRSRVQFGRPIGGFQAVKHMAADLLVESESAITAARSAAEALASSAPNAAELIVMASFAVSEAQSRIAFDSIQLHGGIGFTWEHPAHLYLRRARHDAMFLGSNEQARERFISILEKAA